LIEIVEYNPNWPDEFEKIAAAVHDALGDIALRIEHIGSTSVPGLPAKDIIDVQVAVSRFDEPLEAAFRSIGYTLYPGITSDHQPPNFVGPDSEWEKRYFRAPAGQRPTHMHVRILGSANQRYALLFRDYLRSHPAVAAGYAVLKRTLAQYHENDNEAYTLIKDPVCDVIMGVAEEWAQAVHWSIGFEK
jgi:GrpB-like predicted nucleotidyltransferase (UPF0157 family)